MSLEILITEKLKLWQQQADILRYVHQRAGINMFRDQRSFLLVVVHWLKGQKKGVQRCKKRNNTPLLLAAYSIFPQERGWKYTWLVHMSGCRKRMWSAQYSVAGTQSHNLEHPEIYLKTIHNFKQLFKVRKQKVFII